MQTLRIFISSPGDVADERQIAGKVLERLQGKYWSFVRLDDVFWEQKVIRSTAHYQDELVNPGECEMVVGILWSRLGSLMPEKFRKASGERYQSGTEWELEMAFDAYEQSLAGIGDRAAAKPDIIVYRRNQPRPSFEDPAQEALAAEQITKLEAYLSDNFWFPDGTIKRPVTNYQNLDEFEEKLSSNLEELILRQIPGLKPGFEPPPISGSPFKGLQAFDFADSDRYFGRNREIREIQQRLVASAGKGLPFVLIYGGSGYGKSSLMRAGLAPVLTRPGGSLDEIQGWRRVPFQPAKGTGSLCERLARALIQAPTREEAEHSRHHRHWPLTGLAELVDSRADTPGWDSARLTRYFSDDDQRVFAVAAVVETLESLNRHLLLEIDQLEEMFTTPGIDANQRAAFLRTVGDLCLSGRIWVVATMRSEFFPRVAEQPELFALVGKERGYILPPPDRQSLREIIRYPVLAARLDFERRMAEIEIAGETAKFEYLDDQILSDAESSPDALPLLEFTLQQLYEEKRATLLTWEAYAAAGGLKGAIAKRAREVYDGLDPVAREARHRIFAALVHVDAARNTVTRQRASLEALNRGPGAEDFLQAFLGNHLLITDEDALTGKAIVTLAHEALISHWDELATWIKDHQGDLLARQRLAEQTNLWNQNDRKKTYLLSEARLAEAQRVSERDLFTLSAKEEVFLKLSEQRSRKKLRTLQGALVVFAIVAVAAAGLGVMANTQTKLAKVQTVVANEQTKRADGESQRARQALSRVHYENGRLLNRGDDPNTALPHLAAALEADSGNRLAAAAFLQNLALIPRFLPDELLLQDAAPCSLMETSPTGKRLAAASRNQLHVFAFGDEPRLLQSISMNEPPHRLIWSASGDNLLVLSGSPEDEKGNDPTLKESRWVRRFGADGILRFELEREQGVFDALIAENGNMITRQRSGKAMRLECHDPSGALVWADDLASSVGMFYRVSDDGLLIFMLSKELREIDATTGRLRRILKISELDFIPEYVFDEKGSFDRKVIFSPDGERMALALGHDHGTISDGTSQGVFGCLLVFSTKDGSLTSKGVPELPSPEEMSSGEALRKIYREDLNETDDVYNIAEGCFFVDLHFNASGDELVLALKYGGTLRIQLSDEPGFWFCPPVVLDTDDSPGKSLIEVDFKTVGFLSGMERSFAFSPQSRASGASSPLLPFVQFWEVTKEGCQEFALRIQDKDEIIAVAGGGDNSTVVTAHASGAVVLRRLSEPWRESRLESSTPHSLDKPVVQFGGDGDVVSVLAVETGNVLAELELKPGQEVIAASANRGLVVLGPQGKNQGNYQLYQAGKGTLNSFESTGVKDLALSVDGTFLWVVSTGSEGHGMRLQAVTVNGSNKIGSKVEANHITLLRGTDLAHLQFLEDTGKDQPLERNILQDLKTGEAREKWETLGTDGTKRTFHSANVDGCYFEGEYSWEESKTKIRIVESGSKKQHAWFFPSSRLNIYDLAGAMLWVSPDLSRVYLAAKVGKYDQGGFVGYDSGSARELFPIQNVYLPDSTYDKQIWFSPYGELMWSELGDGFVDAHTGGDCGKPSVPILLPYDLARRVVYANKPVAPEAASAFTRLAVGEELINGVSVPVPWSERFSAAKVFAGKLAEFK